MKRQHPYLLILSSFVLVIFVGSILLVLPWASRTGHSIGYPNALFMSTSSVCVTGLSVLPHSVASDLTLFGKIVMYFLMQIGGLSIITICMFFFSILGAKLGIGNDFLLREQLNQSSSKGLLRMVRNIVIMSMVVQLVGTILIIYPIYEYVKAIESGGIGKAIGISLFHSCASFNNAGFDVFGDEGMLVFASGNTYLSAFNTYLLNITTMIMIIAGGIGYVVINDIWDKKFSWRRLRLHTKITLITTLSLLLVGSIALKFTGRMPWLEAVFSSVTCRTAGFQTYDMANLSSHSAAYIICIILMFIGASPCSCGGGVKTTTLAVILIAVYHFSIGKKNHAFGRKIADDQMSKAYVLMNSGIVAILVTTFIFTISQNKFGFEKALFEVVSAFSTTGLSMGITSSLSVFNKILLSMLMLFGRLGPLTVIGLLNKNWNNDNPEKIEYVEEGVIIG